MNKPLIDKFIRREIRALEVFSIREIDKNTAYEFVRRYHYLGDAKFFCVYAFGLFTTDEYGEELVGCSTFSNPQGVFALKGWFGLENDDQTVLELSRLCMLPYLNGTNATSFLLGNSMRMLKPYGIRAVITLADASRHIGSIYQVCNFKYYGLSDEKTDFYEARSGKLVCRLQPSKVQGVWLPRTRKHRYCYLLDKTLTVGYEERPHPTEKGQLENPCCNGTKAVFDNRFGKWYTCPVCVGRMVELSSPDKAEETIKNLNIKKLGKLVQTELDLFN